MLGIGGVWVGVVTQTSDGNRETHGVGGGGGGRGVLTVKETRDRDTVVFAKHRCGAFIH